MKENQIKKVWNEGRPAVNVFLCIPSSFAAEVMASLGWDAVTVDMQHGVTDYSDMVPMLQGITRYEVAPMVRVPWNDPAIIMKSLDAGAYGVICPMITHAKNAKSLSGRVDTRRKVIGPRDQSAQSSIRVRTITFTRLKQS